MKNTQIVILAAGHGKRMQSDIPKALTSLKGKPFIKHLLDTIKESGVCEKPIIVVGQKGDQVKDFLGGDYTYAVQEEQLGTGHAVMCAENFINNTDSVLVLYADHPLVSEKTIKDIISAHNENQSTITLATTVVSDFNEWRSAFLSFGRIVRGEDNKILKIIESKDATEEEKNIKEVNPSYLCFNNDWLWKNLKNLKNMNAQNEYYLTDLISMAFSQNEKIATVLIEPREALGVNTKEQLEMIENI